MPVSYDLSGKTAVVTGGAKGIGKAIVERLMSSGAQVHVWDLNPVELNSATFTKVDVTERQQIASAIDKLVSKGSRIDILVNDAGYLFKTNAFDEHDPSDWDRILRVNLVGMMQATQLILLETLTSDRADQSLTIAVLPWRPRCDRPIPNAHCSNAPDERLAVDAVSIAHEITEPLLPTIRLRQLATDPFCAGMRRR